jgi:hypothetical protein
VHDRFEKVPGREEVLVATTDVLHILLRHRPAEYPAGDDAIPASYCSLAMNGSPPGVYGGGLVAPSVRLAMIR